MENNKITKIEAIFLILIVMLNRIILNLPYSIIEITKTVNYSFYNEQIISEISKLRYFRYF